MSKPDTPQDYQTRGIHAFSKDGRTNWTINPDPMWETNVTWTNGSATHFYRRQAPTLYFNVFLSPYWRDCIFCNTEFRRCILWKCLVAKCVFRNS